jgi:MinD-like ATPase involved in chromosome partitioning or flagellar assembly
MTARPRVVLALTPLTEREVEPLLFDPSDPALDLLASVVEADELLRAVQEQQRVDAVLLSPELSGLTPAHCERVRATGIRLVGLALDQRERELLDTLEVDIRLDSTVSREELLNAVRGSATAIGENRPVAAPPVTPVAERREDRGGSILAVIGAKGAPGSSECAASLAALAARRWPTLLIEADALGGNLALRLGADPNNGSILGVIRATQAGDGALRELVERWTYEPDGWPSVLLGAPDPRALIDLAQPGAMTHALDALSGLYPLVVCDVGFPIEDARSAHLHREALIAADSVVVVLGAREPQLHAGLRQLDIILTELGIRSERLRTIVNAVGGPSRREKGAITATIAEHLAERDLTVDAWLPWDARGLRRSEQHGKPIALARHRSAFTRALTGLLDELFLPSTSPRTRRRKRRLTAPPGDAPSAEREEVVWQR